MDLTELRLILAEYLSKEELINLCFDLSVDYHSLEGEGLEAKARELVSFLDRHGRIIELIEICRQQRPDIIEHLYIDWKKRKYFVASNRSDTEIDERFNVWGDGLDRTSDVSKAYFVIFDLNRPPADWVRYIGGPEPPFPIIVFAALDGMKGDELDGKTILDILISSYEYPIEARICRTRDELLDAVKRVEWNYAYYQRVHRLSRQLNLARARLEERW